MSNTQPVRPLIDGLRKALKDSDISGRELCRNAGVENAWASTAKFANGERDSMLLSTADALARELGLELVKRKKGRASNGKPRKSPEGS
jgi:predicted transcriptional regulator